jgi:hypothetical protein
LLVNRATLLLLSEELLHRFGPRPDVVRATSKHAAKAILGYGDALLYAHGRYHWSYAEKQRRMRTLAAAPQALRALYDRAAEFRFAPDYDAWRPSNPVAWNRELLQTLADAHLAFERIRLDAPTLPWAQHAEVALVHVPFEDVTWWRAWARKLRSAVRNARSAHVASTAAGRLGASLSSPTTRLEIAFPGVAYDLGVTVRARAAALLGESELRRDALRRAYLARWGAHREPGFAAVARRFELTLESPRRAA